MIKKYQCSGYSILVFAVFTWSFSELIVKLLQESVGAIELSFFRFLIGGIILLIILLIKQDLSDLLKLIKNNLILFIIASCFALGFSNIVYFLGVTFTQANIAATIYTTYPIWITIYSIFILNEEKTRMKFLGIILGMIGVIILLTNFNFLGFFLIENLFGNLLVLLGSVIWSLYSVLGKKIQIKEKNISNLSLKFTMLSQFFACIPLVIILPFSPNLSSFFHYNLTSWFWIIFLGVISTGLGLYLLFWGIEKLEVSKGMSLAFLKPIFATILAFLIINETPSITLLISILLVISSILIINRNPSIKSENLKET
jgi:drug/metabolite transporter (DMT)-like permease